MPHHAPNVLIVDDHCLIRDGIAQLINDWLPQAYVVKTGSMCEAVEACRARHFDIVLLDLSLPGPSGLELLTQLRALYEGISVCVISGYEDPATVARCIELGATSFIAKTGESSTFERDLSIVLAGQPVLPRGYPPRTHPGQVNRPSIRNVYGLTSREQDVMLWLAKGYSNKRIAQRLGILPDTVKFHVSGILKKLNVRTRGEAIAVFSAARDAAVR